MKLATKRRLKIWRKSLDPKLQGRDRTRELVRIRDGHLCQMCYKPWIEDSRRLDVHHLHGLCGVKSTGYDSVKDIDNLITLCHKCHYNHHEFSKRLEVINDIMQDYDNKRS